MPNFYIGTSGFSYKHWRGSFYPDDLPPDKWLDFYSKKFNTVELNVTFYRLPTKNAFKNWREETPKDFVFSIKGSRLITHFKKLKSVKADVAKFFDAASHLKRKLKAVLWQFPANFKYNEARIKDFLEILKKYPYNSAFEFRNNTWINARIYKLFKKYNTALAEADWPEFLKNIKPTASFYYIRRHGLAGSYSTCYSDDELKQDARKIKSLIKSRIDVYGYFNNDAFAYAPKNAEKLIDLLSTQKSINKPSYFR